MTTPFACSASRSASADLPDAVGPAITATRGLSFEVPLYIATLIAVDRLDAGQVSAALDTLANAGCGPTGWAWLDEGQAADLRFERHPAAARDVLEAGAADADVAVQPEQARSKRLLVADMDSTMITVECIDELADYAGIKAEVADVTERAMRGELDFAAALDARVALLAGLEETAIDRCLAERVRLMPGAELLVRTMRANGGRCVLVSGGFTRFAEPVGARIGFHRVIANRLEVAGGRLTGHVERPIVGAETKERTLIEEREALALADAQTLAVGDGANDLPMICRAGLGVAYCAKPVVAAAAAVRVERTDLTSLLYMQGYPRSTWRGA